ncbi:hypothetical protein M758_1G300200 [Ceratodon purpureus]|nr:hypothetical protein M758_1G300200 [Ceratodon purpureus]
MEIGRHSAKSRLGATNPRGGSQPLTTPGGVLHRDAPNPHSCPSLTHSLTHSPRTHSQLSCNLVHFSESHLYATNCMRVVTTPLHSTAPRILTSSNSRLGTSPLRSLPLTHTHNTQTDRQTDTHSHTRTWHRGAVSSRPQTKELALLSHRTQTKNKNLGVQNYKTSNVNACGWSQPCRKA